jgi:translation initiation factor 2B subunit (eIF-2B alpha/beta/delta family)
MSDNNNEYWRSQVEKIKEDSFNGSGYLSNQALEIIEEFIENKTYNNRTELLQSLAKLSNALVRAKPLMALIYNRTQHIIDFIQNIPKDEKDISKIRYMALDEIKVVRNLFEKKVQKITQFGSKVIMDHHVILIHSYSKLVEMILLDAKKHKKRFKVICTESRPLLEGSKMALTLAKAGTKTTLIPDADLARAVNEAHFVLTGTDRITETTFISKTGTHAMAVLAHHLNKPFYIVGESDKILLKRTFPVRFLKSAGKELFDQKNDNLTISNKYFEETPISFLHKLINEDGIFELKEFVDRYL